jgi:hypothetical protein
MLAWNRAPGLLGECAPLPSAEAACGLVEGKSGSLAKVIGTTALRAALIGVGLAVAGERQHLVRNSVAGALGIELFVLGWALFARK